MRSKNYSFCHVTKNFREVQVFGEDFYSANVILKAPVMEDIPDPKCNTVCFMKSENVTANCKNYVAVTDKYICYAVKGSLLRAIHTQSGKMILLRGHESPVLDLKFSPVERNLLGTVDNGHVGGSHVFIWQLIDTLELSHSILCQFSIPAEVIQPHPTLPQIWAISNNNKLGILSTILSSLSMSLSTMEHLSMHTTLDGKVIGILIKYTIFIICFTY